MQRRNLTGTVTLGSLTATIALIAGLSNAGAQSAPGGGSFPQSFLIPGTNTSLSLYGVIKMSAYTQAGSQHTNDTSPSGGGATAFQIGSLALEGPGASAGTSVQRQEYAIHGGLRASVKSTTFTFETRTPTDLGELKTVMSVDFSLFASQNNYVGQTTSTTKPSAGVGNTEAPRLLWAYGTLGPWLIGQTNTAWADPLLSPSDIGDPTVIGYVTTANVRRPQVRYTYLAGNGITLSGSLESNYSDTLYISPQRGGTVVSTATIMTNAAIGSFSSDNLDPGGIQNLPSFNTGIAWDQPWGHLMARVGVAQNEIRNSASGISINAPACIAGAMCTSNGANNITKWGWAAETGIAVNTWGQDQWKGLINYSVGAATYLTDQGVNANNMFVNGFTGQVDLIRELALNTSYTHRFNPNWRMTAEFGVGFFSKPKGAEGLTNLCGTGPATCNGTAAQLASFEKRHLNSALAVTWAPLPGLFEIHGEWDHWERTVQASNTWGASNKYGVSVNFYW